jgi:hypothetical protein
MPRVFVTQLPHRLDRSTGRLEPVFDITPAGRYGQVEFLLKPGAKPFDPAVLDELRRGLEDFQDDDFLLLLGSPAIMGWACALAADYNDGKVKILQWSNTEQDYVVVAAELFADAA